MTRKEIDSLRMRLVSEIYQGQAELQRWFLVVPPDMLLAIMDWCEDESPNAETDKNVLICVKNLAMQKLQELVANDTSTAVTEVSEYGCCLCQREGKPHWHRKGDELYDQHLIHQSKHGIRHYT